MRDNQIWVTAGPNWERDRAVIMAEGSQSLIENMHHMEKLVSLPVQDSAAYAQTSLSNRFQRYTDSWFDTESPPRTELMDFGLVKEMKVAMFVGLFDTTCPLPTVVAQKAQMGDTVAMWQVSPF